MSIREATGVNSNELRSEKMNLSLPRHRHEYNSMYNLSGSFIPGRVRCVALTCRVAPRDVLRHFFSATRRSRPLCCKIPHTLTHCVFKSQDNARQSAWRRSTVRLTQRNASGHRRRLSVWGTGAKFSWTHRRRKGSVVGGTMASAEHKHIMGVWGHSPQRCPEAEPLVTGSGGQSPLKLKAFWSLDVQRSRQI